MRHQIDIEGLTEWVADQEILFASSSKEQKRLYVTMNGNYKVYHKGELVLETSMAYGAVKKYNEL